MYSKVLQDTLSFPGYWWDPNHARQYLARCSFLPKITGQANVSANGVRYRANLMRINASVFVGGPDDGVIGPWQSAHWGAVPPGSSNESDIVLMRAQPTYVSDAIGLRSLDEAGKVELYVRAGIKHSQWLTDETVFEEAIEPLLN